MARRRRRRHSYGRRTRGVGSVIRVRRTRGLGQLDNPKSALGAFGPAALGGGVAAAVIIGIRQLMKPTTEAQIKVMQYAPAWGGLAGTITAMLMAWATKKPYLGWAAGAGSTLVAGSLALSEMAAKKRLAELAPQAAAGMRPYGLGAIVMEPHAGRGYGAGPLGRAGTSAIVPEYSNTRGLAGRRVGAYGDVVNLGGVTPNAFGTPGFQVAGRRG